MSAIQYCSQTAVLNEMMMGPNALRIVEELTRDIPLRPGMRVLDLGCGTGLTSVYLAERFGVSVFAADLWIDPTENAVRFRDLGLDAQITPLRCEAHTMPFAHDWFDAVISVDAYHYFGTHEDYLETHLRPLLKNDAWIAVAVPGLQHSLDAGIPAELQPFWQPDMNFCTCDWWQQLWQDVPGIALLECRELACCHEAWQEWLKCDNPYAIRDRDMIAAERGRYFNLIALTARAV